MFSNYYTNPYYPFKGYPYAASSAKLLTCRHHRDARPGRGWQGVACGKRSNWSNWRPRALILARTWHCWLSRSQRLRICLAAKQTSITFQWMCKCACVSGVCVCVCFRLLQIVLKWNSSAALNRWVSSCGPSPVSTWHRTVNCNSIEVFDEYWE